MTREEAIEILNRPFNMKNVPAEIIEAHEMAIKALEQEEKSECEHDHELVKAYNDGQEFILDKIKVELLATAEKHADGDYYLRDKWVSEIIDKYRQEG